MQLLVDKESIMVVLALAALSGGIATAVWMADYGPIGVILTMPVGGSLAGLAAAVLIGMRYKTTKREMEALTLPDLIQPRS
jgi:hypothetical protein